MLKLRENEKVLLSLHKHWIIIAERLLTGFFLLAFPLPASFLIRYINLGIENIWPYFWFFSVLYMMLVSLFIFLAWLDYYLDVWIITTERIIDIEQHGLFKREVSEFMLSRVQDVTIQIPNMLAMMLKYGNIDIQTAGERSFSIKQIPDIYVAKDTILEAVKKQNHVRA
jgi:hypothetical protein